MVGYILVADDDPVYRSMIEDTLGCFPGFVVMVVASGDELVSSYKALPKGAKVSVIADRFMKGGISGLDALVQIRDYENSLNLKPSTKILFSGSIDAATFNATIELPATPINKPYVNALQDILMKAA